MQNHTTLGQCLILIFFLPYLTQADTLSVLHLTEIIEEAKMNNPEIKAAKAYYEAAQLRTSVLRNIMDPMFSIENAGEVRMYSITQQLPFPTKLTTLSNFARIESEEYESKYNKKEQDVINKVKRSYAGLFLVHKKIETIEESISFLNQLFHIASHNYSIGKVSQVDVLRAQVELAKAENDLLTLIDKRKIAEVRLNTLLNRDVDSKLGIPEEIDTSEITLDIDKLYELTRENQPELKASNQMFKKAKVMVSIAKQTYLPDFMFKFTQQEMDNSFTDRKFMVGLTIPLWFWGKQNDIIREMNANLKMAEMQYNAILNKVLLAVKESKINLDNYRREQALYKNSIIPQADASLKSALIAYGANQTDFLSVLESERILIQFELEFYSAKTDFFIALADLEKAVGINLVKN